MGETKADKWEKLGMLRARLDKLSGKYQELEQVLKAFEQDAPAHGE